MSSGKSDEKMISFSSNEESVPFPSNGNHWHDNGKITYGYVNSCRLGDLLSDGEWSYAWAKGRQLASMSKPGSALAFTYDAPGQASDHDRLPGQHGGRENPHRYRGYRYDAETGLYALKYRYYSFQINRFLSADDNNFLGASNYGFSYNLYSYCDNNPVIRYDYLGLFWDYQYILDFLRCTTFTNGVSIGGTLGIWDFSGSIGLTIDGWGSITVQGAWASGPTIGTPSFTILRYQTIMHAPSYESLENDGVEVGGSVLVPVCEGVAGISIGVDFNIAGNPTDGHADYYGFTVSQGLGLGAGAEGHVHLSQTKTIAKLNSGTNTSTVKKGSVIRKGGMSKGKMIRVTK